MKRQEDTEPNNNSGSEEVKMTALWLQRLGTLFPSNASLKEETRQPPADESLSRPTRGGRLSAEDVLRNVTSSASIGSNTSSNAPSSILKSHMVHSNAIDTNQHVDEEAAKDTVYMLRLLMMSDFFTGKDRVNVGLPAAESHPNTSPFKPDSSVISAVKTPHVNLHESKEEEWGGEEDKEKILSDVAPEANTGHPPQPQASSLTSLLSYKPRRANSSTSIGENASTNSAEESFSGSAKALRSSSTPTARTQSTCNSDSKSQPSSTTEEDQLNRLKAELLGQSDEDVGAMKSNEEHPTQMILDSAMLSNYKPQRKISPPSSEKNLLSGHISRSGPVFESFNTIGSTPSTGTFRDTKKRFVPTLANSSESQDQDIKTRNNSWGNLKEKPCSNDNMTSPLSAVTSMLKQKDLFPSTGTFRDSAKRHVRIRSESNQEWDAKPRNVDIGTMLSRPSMPSSEKAAAAAPPGPAEASVSNFLKDNIFPSTGTFRDTDKRHVRHITEPSVNQEWELKCQNHRKAKSFSGPSIGFSLSTGSIIDASKRQVGSRHHHQQELEGKFSNPNQECGKLAPFSAIDTPDAEVKGSEPKKQTNLLQLYMENKAKLARESQPQHQPSVNRGAGIPPNAEAEAEPSEAAELLEQAPKGELLVDWGDQGADSLEDDESLEEEENNGTITFVKNDSSRRISDITTVDDFDDDDDDLGLDASFEMRERIRKLTIPEERKWMQSHDNDEESSDEKQYNNSSRRISDITTDDDFDDEMDLGLVASLEMRQRIRSLSIPEECKWIQSHEESDEKQDDGFFLADTGEVVGEKAPPTDLVLVRRNSDDTSASSETVKTSGRKGDAIETSVDNNTSSVEMGKGLIRNMSAITLHEMSDEELDDS